MTLRPIILILAVVLGACAPKVKPECQHIPRDWKITGQSWAWPLVATKGLVVLYVLDNFECKCGKVIVRGYFKELGTYGILKGGKP